MKYLFTALCFISLHGFSQSVTFDPAFGNSGLVITPGTTETTCIAIDAQGNIYSSGPAQYGIGVYQVAVTKTDSNGVPDPGFGINGMVTTHISYSEFVHDIVLQDDGRIVVAGSANLPPTQSGPGDYFGFAVRYNADGTIDSSFATNGIFRSNLPDSHFSSVMSGPGNSVFLAGNTYTASVLVRLDSSGTEDPLFGSGGIAYLSSTNFQFVLWSAIMLADNHILCVGYEGSDMGNTALAYCKVDLLGNFATGFGLNGTMSIDSYNQLPNIMEIASDARELPDGRIMIGGYTMSNFLMRIHPDGMPDSTFGTNAILNHSHPFRTFIMQPDGRILLGGNTEISDYNYGYIVTRLQSNGDLDSAFNGTGNFTADISPLNDYLQCISLQSPGKLIIGGSSRTATDANFTLARLNLNTGPLGIPAAEPLLISVYPNPFSGSVSIRTDQDDIRKITVFDASGKCLGIFGSYDGSPLQLDVPAGTYHLRIETGSGRSITKTVIRR